MNVVEAELAGGTRLASNLGADDRREIEVLASKHSVVLWDDALCDATARHGRFLDARLRTDLDVLFERDEQGSIHAVALLDTAGEPEMRLGLLADGVSEALHLVPLLTRVREAAVGHGASKIRTSVGIEVPHVLEALREAGFTVTELMSCGGSAQVTLVAEHR